MALALRDPWRPYAWFPGACCLLALVAPISRSLLESSLPTHVLIQLPGLALAGALIGQTVLYFYGSRIVPYNVRGLPGLLLALFAGLFWMLPRSLDAALTSPTMALMKFLTVPFLVGLPLALAWPQLGPVLRGFFLVNLNSMLLVLAWLYSAAPVRLCNSYLVSEQQQLGRGFLAVVSFCLFYCVARCLVSQPVVAVSPLHPRAGPNVH